jgi:mono/diheme cytochrome c family protein
MLGAAALLVVGAASCKDKSATGDTAKASGNTVVANRYVKDDPAMVAQGKASFGACMGCHGEKGDGRVGIGPRLVSQSFLEAAGDDFIFANIKNGRTGTTMIPWGATYSDAQIESIISYIRSEKPTTAANLDENPLQGDVAKGGESFRAICASCHGRAGGGYQETSNGTGIGRKVFLDKASNGFIRHIAREGKSHTAMKGFAAKDPTAVANLSDVEIDNIISYLRHNAW